MSDLDDILFSQVQTCANCNHVVHPPYNQCVRKHKYCPECTVIYKPQFCPKCNNGYNLILGPNENSCNNVWFGCKYIGDISQCMKHLKTCKYGPYPCPWSTVTNTCKWDGMHTLLTKHIGEAHSELIRWGEPENAIGPKVGYIEKFNGEWFKFPTDTSKTIDIAFRSYKQWFSLSFKIDNVRYLKVQIDHLALKHEQEEKMFKYNIRFGKKNEKKREGVVIDCGNYCRVYLKDLSRMCQENGDLPYEIEIFDKETHLESGFVLA